MKRPEPFEMMHWAKRRAERGDLSLGGSGVSSPPGFELSPGPSDPDPLSSVGNYYGLPSLREAIADAYEVDPEAVLVSNGTSLANYTALTVLVPPGTRVLVERPTYATLERIPRFHGARVETLERRPENGWVPSLEELRRRAEEEPLRAVVLTRPHNPTGTDLPRPFLEDLARLADAYDFRVLFDEVYLDFLDESSSACQISPRFLCTSSLTKVYGFGGLRVGWLLGDPRVIEPMKEFSFYLAVNGSTWAQTVATRVLRQRASLVARSRAIAARGLGVLEQWIEGRRDVGWTRPDGGLSAFLELRGVEDTARFAERLFEEHDVALAAGEFFGWPGWVRVCFGLEPDSLREALRRVGLALDEWKR